MVRFKKLGLVATVYQGRSSYEVGFEIESADDRFSLGELIRAEDPAEGAQYRNPAATTQSGLVDALQSVAGMVQRYGQRALDGDPKYFAELRGLRQSWAEAYALDVLAEQLRPKAHAAFQEGSYRLAAELYEQMAARLTPTEQKKLEVARERSAA